jgi:hypothetical protein
LYKNEVYKFSTDFGKKLTEEKEQMQIALQKKIFLMEIGQRVRSYQTPGSRKTYANGMIMTKVKRKRTPEQKRRSEMTIEG